jgi:sugar phosphate isomerase/epimerase
MRLAIVVNATPKATPLAADIPLEDAVALAKDAGFDGVELAIADPRDVDVANLTRMLESYGLEVGYSKVKQVDFGVYVTYVSTPIFSNSSTTT